MKGNIHIINKTGIANDTEIFYVDPDGKKRRILGVKQIDFDPIVVNGLISARLSFSVVGSCDIKAFEDNNIDNGAETGSRRHEIRETD